jgi:phosphoglycolate phosphatase-like HAD superfamily hydrolase
VSGEHVASIWSRSGLTPAFTPDCVALDVDGVLIDTTGSFREATRITVTEVQRALGRSRPWTPAAADIAMLKHAGGFNDDIDCSIALAAVALAGREPELEAVCRAVDIAGGGLQGLRVAAPDLPRIAGRLVLRIFNQHYWGGLRDAERALVDADLPQRIRALGVRHVALITGRTPTELDAALTLLAWAPGDLDAVVSGDQLRKPDPACLDRVLEITGAQRLVMVGDTRDDWEMVRRHRERGRGSVELRAVSVGDADSAIALRSLGVDATLERTRDLLGLLARWAAPG